MYRVTAECDGREQLGTLQTRDCYAAMTLPVPDAEDAAVAARTLKQAAEEQGWNTDCYDEHEVLFCPDCWPEWLEFEERRGAFLRRQQEEGKVAELKDPEWQETQAAVLRAWESSGLVEPGWSVEYHAGDGAYRARFTLRARVGPSTASRRYDLSEIEFTTYVMALADLAPHLAGEAGITLADESREEAP